MGAEFDSQPSYSMASSYEFLQTVLDQDDPPAAVPAGPADPAAVGGICDISPDYSPIMGFTGVDGFLITTGWGTWGFKAIPAGGEAMAELIATGKAPSLIAAVRRSTLRGATTPWPTRDRRGRADAVDHLPDLRRAAGRRVPLRRRAAAVPDSITDPDARNVDWVWMQDNVDGMTTERWFHAAGCRRWLTLRRDTTTDAVVEIR